MELYIKSCKTCQSRQNLKARQTLTSIVVKERFGLWGIDLIGPLKETKSGYNYLCVSVDHCTKWVEAAPLKTKEAAGVTKFLLTLVSRFGCPKQLLSDRGREFCNKAMQDLLAALGVKKSTTSAYHPQCNGQTERTNQTLQDAIAKLTPANGVDNWDETLEQVLFGMRINKHASTKKSPFEALYGREVRLPIDFVFGDPVDLIDDDYVVV